VALAALVYAAAPAAALNRWVDTDPTSRTSVVNKPVDPVFINYGNGTIEILQGESWDIVYDLRSGKRYHIFLVGEWVHNDTDPVTDYDIYAYEPSGKPYMSYTESAGLPEQVVTEPVNGYFEPPVSGHWTFRIVNDERDSKNFEPAIFMVIEHLEVNAEYSQFLEGREFDEEVLYTGWAYEFNTTSPKIKVFVEVPSSLDMYEARLYKMANPDRDEGYKLYGTGVPLGEYFEGFVGEYGGYNTSAKGDRNIEAMDSGEFSGQDLEFEIQPGGSDPEGYGTYYYLVLIAEHDQGTVHFIIQTDFSPPTINLVDPPTMALEDEDATIKAIIEDETEIESAWLRYTRDGGEDWYEKEMIFREGEYICDIGGHISGENVKYEVYAEDEFGNTGNSSSSFYVMRTVTIECIVMDASLKGGESAKVFGSSGLSSSPVNVSYSQEGTSESYVVQTDEYGDFSHTYTPEILGDWSVKASFLGSDTELPAESDSVSFTVESTRTQIAAFLTDRAVKKNEPITIAGSVKPSEEEVPVQIMLVSGSSSHIENVPTSPTGEFSLTYTPEEKGVWNALVKVGDGFVYEFSQSGIMEFDVLPLTIVEKITVILVSLTTPPYLYGSLGVLGVFMSSALYVKRESVVKALPEGLAKRFSGNGKKKKKKNKNSQRFRRKSK